MDIDDEALARQNEEELWLQEQTPRLEVNINWKHVLKQAKEEENASQCKDIS